MVRIALSPELSDRTTIPVALKQQRKQQPGASRATPVGAVLEWPSGNASLPILAYENHQALRQLLFPALPTASRSPFFAASSTKSIAPEDTGAVPVAIGYSGDYESAATSTIITNGGHQASSQKVIPLSHSAAQREVVSIMESMHVYLFDFTKQTVLSAVSAALSLDELHLPVLTPGAAAGAARRAKGEGGGTLGFGGLYDYWVGGVGQDAAGKSSDDDSDYENSNSRHRGGGVGPRSQKPASSVLEGRLSTSAGRFGLYLSLLPVFPTTSGGTIADSVPSSLARKAATPTGYSLAGGCVFKFSKHFCGPQLFMSNAQDTKVRKIVTEPRGSILGQQGDQAASSQSSWALSFVAATATNSSPLQYLNVTPSSSANGPTLGSMMAANLHAATPASAAELVVTFQIGTVKTGAAEENPDLLFDPFNSIGGGGGPIPTAMVGFCTRSVATAAATCESNVPLGTAWATPLFDGVTASTSGISGWMFDVVTGTLFLLRCSGSTRQVHIQPVTKLENYCDIVCVPVAGDSTVNTNKATKQQDASGSSNVFSFGSSAVTASSSSTHAVCPPITMHISIPLNPSRNETSDILVTATLRILCKGHTVHKEAFPTTKAWLETALPCAQLYDDGTTVEMW